jgi:hypothetical protein
MEELIEEFEDWQRQHDYVVKILGYDLCAHELLLVEAVVHHGRVFTPAHRAWLNDYIERWDRQQALVDRIGSLMERQFA